MTVPIDIAKAICQIQQIKTHTHAHTFQLQKELTSYSHLIQLPLSDLPEFLNMDSN